MQRAMKLLPLLAACALSCSAPTTSAATDPWETPPACQERLKNAVLCFGTHARSALALCSLRWEAAMVGGSSDAAAACTRSAKDAMTLHYQATLKNLKTPQAQSMLKDAYAFWSAAMNGLLPSGTKLDYSRRKIEKEVELDRMLTRLELEG